ncbi:hypothetical protein Cantr_04769 [Candida viswanathii]|uniref:Protein SKG6 n=1 Tax=Candida viswanathii TaxID=5486 RepID=A0A367XMJ1_9ASCO|nr:hypothetical protein Cantr_04769 [Candida viswanathii]
MAVYRRGTPTIQIRASRSSDDSSSSSSDYCKDNPKSNQCEKPVSDNSVTIALSIVLPCLAIFAVLGWFLYRNYRKDKKESMEHDPDFDENGEATALPDYPHIKSYGENPFDNRNSIRYPMDNVNGHQYGQQQPQQQQKRDPYLDSFVLPYQHQTGSKLSLDDYARNLGDLQGYQTPSNAIGRSRANSMHLDQKSSSMLSARGGGHHSRQPSSAKSPTKKKDGKQYTNIPNQSEHNLAYEPNRVVGAGGANDSDEPPSSSSLTPPVPDEKLAHKYETETESDTTLSKSTIPQIMISENNVDDSPSPFDDEHEHAASATETTVDTIPKDDDFDFDDNTKQARPKSPRISAFNLLKNESDAEDDDEDDDDDGMNELSPEQKEEIKRMKSVYKVYFDKESTPKQPRTYELENNYPPVPTKINNELKMDTDYDKRVSTASSVYNDTDDVEQHQQYYYNQFNQQYQQQFGSPVDPNFYHQFQQQQYYNFYQHEQQKRIQQSKKPLPPLQKLPNPSDFRKSTLQTYTDFKPNLKNQPSSGGKQPFIPIENDGVWTSPINSPSIQSQASFPLQVHHNHPHNHTPLQQNNGPESYFPDQEPPQSATSPPHNVPSATQLARSSVVMLNPVTEITKQRKFRPAGSLPHAYQPQPQQYGQSELNGPENDLIPGSRKSDVRRMMNSNF